MNPKISRFRCFSSTSQIIISQKLCLIHSSQKAGKKMQILKTTLEYVAISTTAPAKHARREATCIVVRMKNVLSFTLPTGDTYLLVDTRIVVWNGSKVSVHEWRRKNSYCVWIIGKLVTKVHVSSSLDTKLASLETLVPVFQGSVCSKARWQYSETARELVA